MSSFTGFPTTRPDGKAGLINYFGDGSDGAFSPNLTDMTTAPNGGTIANLWDRSTATAFTTNTLAVTDGLVVFSIDFGNPQTITNFRLWSVIGATTGGTTRIYRLESSGDNLSWIQRTTFQATTSPQNYTLTVSNITAQFWRLVTTTSGTSPQVSTLAIRNITINYDSAVDTETNRVWNIFLPNTADTTLVTRNYTSLTIPAGHTLTTQNRAKGLIIYVQGDLVVSGTISMTARAAKSTATDPPTIGKDLRTTQILNSFGLQLQRLGGAGGRGARGGSPSNYLSGAGGTGGAPQYFGGGYGGGGGGGNYGSSGFIGGAGGNAPVVGAIGGNGGGAVSNAHGLPGGAGAGGSGGATSGATSGAGGNCNGAGGGGGGGSSSGTAGGGGTGEAAGGILVVIVGGNITINSGSLISANGSVGGGGGSWAGTGYPGGGGGGAGGGVVVIVRKSSNSFVNNGTLQANGGSGGSGGFDTSSAGTVGYTAVFTV